MKKRDMVFVDEIECAWPDCGNWPGDCEKLKLITRLTEALKKAQQILTTLEPTLREEAETETGRKGLACLQSFILDAEKLLEEANSVCD